MKRYLVIGGLLLLAGCSADTPASPSDTGTCQTNKTAILSFQNLSPNNRTFDVYLDFSKQAVLAPQQRSPDITVVAGVQHSIVWYLTNTQSVACGATPIPVACSVSNHTCGF